MERKDHMSKWTAATMPSLHDRLAVVTGAKAECERAALPDFMLTNEEIGRAM